MEKMIDRKNELKGRNNTPATIQKYRRCKAHLAIMIKSHYKTNDLPFSKIDLGFIENMELHLRKHGCGHNSTMKYLQTLKSVLHHARAHGHIAHDPFQQYKIRLQQVERPYLSDEEIERMIQYLPATDRIRKVRDIFIFSCFTGLAYIDIKGLRKKHISIEHGRYWIRTHRQKTNTRANIPLLEVPLRLIRSAAPDLLRAEPESQIFQVPSNQKMNKYLKELATECHIAKRLTFHIARHTFATTVTLSNGVPIESVSAMLGHKDLATTQHYAKLLDKKLEEDMSKLSARLLKHVSQPVE
jgi:site-specific recombinase XerD